jgi:hypothetical protein
MTKSRVLFLCTHKSACFHMAEGSLRRLAGDRFEVISAGREATSVRPEAVAAMAELGVGISGQESKTLECYLGEPSTTSSPSATTQRGLPAHPRCGAPPALVVSGSFAGNGRREGAAQGVEDGAGRDPDPHQRRAP